MIESLCETCRHLREIVTPRESRFLLCRLSIADSTYSKYPRQPVIHCEGFQPKDEAQDE